MAKNMATPLDVLESGMVIISDTADCLSVSRSSIYKLNDTGNIKAVKTCGRLRIPRSDVLNLVRA